MADFHNFSKNQQNDAHFKTTNANIPRQHDKILKVEDIHPNEQKNYFTDAHEI